MKGLLYSDFLLTRIWFVGTGITAAVCTALGVLLELTLGTDDSFREIVPMALTAMAVVTISCMSECTVKAFVKNLKNRFADYSLAAGISKNTFVLTQLVENLIVMAASFALGSVMNLIYMAVDSSFITANNFKLIAAIVLLEGIFTWVSQPLTIKFKSEEKAGMFVGIILGFIFIVLMSVSIVSGEFGTDAFLLRFVKLTSEKWFVPLAIGCAAAIYAMFYVILLKRVKRGDVC